MNATVSESLATHDSVGQKIIPLVPKEPEKRADVSRHRFRILTFNNRGGTKSWRVTGGRRDGRRVRENFSDQTAAEIRRTQLEAEFFSRAGEDTALRATRLTDTQLRIAETCFIRLDEDHDMLTAINNWLDHGRTQAVVESPRLDDATESFLAWVKGTESLRPRTKGKLRNRVNLFRNSVPNLRVAEITPEVIEKFFAARNVAALTKIGDRAAISRFFSWCIDRPRRWARANPCREIRLEQKHDQSAPAILTVADCKKLLSAAENYKAGELVPYVSVCLFGGLRPAEAQRLTRDSVNLADGEIRIESQSSKTKRPRVVAIDKTLNDWLVAYAKKPLSPANLRRHLDVLKVKAGYTGRVDKHQSDGLKPWPADVMRHTAISHYFRLTGSYGKTAEQFGNSEAIIKKHYQGSVSSADTKAFYALQPEKRHRG